MNKTPDAMNRLVEELLGCLRAARDQGFHGPAADWEPTEYDALWICRALGWAPTDHEWDTALRRVRHGA